MRPILALGLVCTALTLITGLVTLQRQSRFESETRDCESRLHLLAKRLEIARWNANPKRYVTCLAELEQIEGQRRPEYEEYRYRVEGDGQNYEVTCKTGHGGSWPAYSHRRGLYPGTPTR
jgi:hypothetical protein